jgi:hypothetical protein
MPVRQLFKLFICYKDYILKIENMHHLYILNIAAIQTLYFVRILLKKSLKTSLLLIASETIKNTL